MSQNFAPGQVVYLSDHSEVTYAGAHPDRAGWHVVSVPIYGGEEGDEVIDYEIRAVDKVHADEPVRKLQSEVYALQKQITEKRAELREVEALAAKVEETKQRLTVTHASLQRLDDYLAGRITHVVVGEKLGRADRVRNIQIREWSTEAKDRYDGSGIALLSLFGTPKGEKWRLNDYKDGSGSWRTVIPCLSLEEAQALARELILAALATITTEYDRLCNLLQSAAEIGIEVPAKYTEAKDRADRAHGQRRIAELEKEIAATRAKYLNTEQAAPVATATAESADAR